MIISCVRAILAAAIFTLFGWVSGAFAEVDLNPIRSIAIDPEIQQPEIPLIQSPGNFKAFLIAGGIGAASDQAEAGKAFREYMRKKDIDISKIVLDSFKHVIEEDKPFALVADADATLKLAINSYGFGVAGLFGGDARRPLINITASLVSRNGDVVWKKTDFITNMSKLTEAYTYDQLAKDPQLTAKSFEQASVLVSRLVFADLKK